MGQLKELQLNIAASLFIKPCDEKELLQREFLKNKSAYGVSLILQMLETDKAIYYKGEVIHTYKSWAKKNLKG